MSQQKKNQKRNPNYKHNPGGDDLVELPEELKYLEEKGITAHKYGNYVLLKGPGYDTGVLDEILGKIKNQENVVIVITGPPGTGKTYMGLFFGQLLDPKFHVTDIPPPPPSGQWCCRRAQSGARRAKLARPLARYASYEPRRKALGPRRA